MVAKKASRQAGARAAAKRAPLARKRAAGKAPAKPAARGPSRAREAPHGADAPAAKLIDAKIEEFADWRGEALARVRRLIREAVPEVVEEVKWRKPSNPMGVPVWSHAGMICTGEVYRDRVKLTFARGAALADPAGLFNASLEGNERRAIDIHEGDPLDEKAFKSLFRAAALFNEA
ncbi:MAG: DUF1801 domain-containing protein [Thermoplasmatota archaeon]